MKCPHCNKNIKINLSKSDDKPPVEEKADKLFCEVCSKEILPVDVDLKGQPRHFEPEQIVFYSQRNWTKNICWKCQNETDDGN